MTVPAPAHERLRLAILGTRGIPAAYGGFETFAQELAVRLVGRGHQVTVYGRRHVVAPTLDGRDFRGVAIRVLPTIRQKYLDTVVHGLLSCLDAVRRRYDAIILCNAANSPFAPLPRLVRTKVVINVDGIEHRRRKWNRLGRAYYLLGEWCAARLPDAVIADAESVAAYYRARHHIEPVVIPYGGDLPPVDDGPATLAGLGIRAGHYVLYVSRLEPENNADVVIRAFRGLDTDLQLVVVGDAPYADAYKRELRALAAGDARIVFTGFQFGRPYHALQRHATCYVQATEVGGTHPALVEAMAAGNCVLVNGTPENLEVAADAGLAYAVNDALDLRARLAAVLADPSLRREYSRRAAARAAAHYGWDAVTDRYEALLRRLVTGTAAQ